MYLTQSNTIRGLTKNEYSMLREMCLYSNNLYNVAIYNIRQYYFSKKKFLVYKENYHFCKTNENFHLLQSNVAEQILMVADRSYKSFFARIKEAKAGKNDFNDFDIPGYRKKGSLFCLIIPVNAVHIKNGYLKVPMSKEFLKRHDNKRIYIPFPKRLEDKKIKEVRICPVSNGQYFKIHYCYLQESEPQDVSIKNVLAIDIGLDNLATCITNTGTTFIMDGRKLKSINQYWNKQKSYYQKIANKQRRNNTNRLNSITMKRNNQATDFIRKTARYIINFCIEHRIGTIVCGYNTGIKNHINLGKVKNQQFVQISFGYLRSTLEYLSERYGIRYIEQEESYTSKASCLDMDYIPVYDPEHPYEGTFSGKRIYRGLYQFSDGRIANADVNAAANILRKSKQNFNIEELRRGLLASPLRIRIS